MLRAQSKREEIEGDCQKQRGKRTGLKKETYVKRDNESEIARDGEIDGEITTRQGEVVREAVKR